MMSTLVSIDGVADAGTLAKHKIRTMPVLVLFPHNQCNCRCMMCDIWRIRQANQITPEDLDLHLQSFRDLGLRWVVFSGGEPQLNEKWSWLAQMLRSVGCRITLLSAGLLLESQANLISESVDDVIVSLDGPPAIHNSIRRIPNAFEQMAEGVRTLHQIRPAIPVRARCTVQKANHRALRAVVDTAKEAGLGSVSFLAADLASTAFNRTEPWPDTHAARVALLPREADQLEAEIESLILERKDDFESGFIVEEPGKLRRIVHHFRAHLGQLTDVAPHCNAPWVSAVIEASGDVRPCFFQPALGNIHRQGFTEIINGPDALRFRSTLDVAENETCRKCVCSLYIAPNPDQPF